MYMTATTRSERLHHYDLKIITNKKQYKNQKHDSGSIWKVPWKYLGIITALKTANIEIRL